jgi:hypothetical protein
MKYNPCIDGMKENNLNESILLNEGDEAGPKRSRKKYSVF